MNNSESEYRQNNNDLVSPEGEALPLKQPSSQPSHKGDIPKFKITELRLSMNRFHNARLKWINKFHENILEGFSIKNPEFKIKILEDHLNFLNKKSSKYKALQMKSNICSFETNLALTQRNFNNKNNYKDLKSSLSLQNREKIILQNKIQSENKLNTSSNCISSHTSTKTQGPACSEGKPTVLFTSKDRFSYDKKEPRSSSTDTIHTSSDPVNIANTKSTNTLSVLKDTREEIDNQFKFTVEEEKIVSFVCSPSPPRKECSQTICYHIDCENDYDTESENQTESTTSRGDSLLETLSNISGRSNCFEELKISSMDELPTVNHWHCQLSMAKPPDTHDPVMGKMSVNYSPSVNRCLKTSSSVVTNSSYDCITTLSNDEKLYISLSQETILFREASLRGCYNIESILNHMKPPLTDVEKETSDVKGLIFSSIRPQNTNGNMVGDTVLSILEICKSWIKVNSHFERKEFKDILKLQGVDPSLLNDFLQWQCVSRLFIDKMLQALNKIAPKNLTSESCKNLCPNDSMPASITINYQDFVHGGFYINTVNSGINSSNVLQSKNFPPKNQLAQHHHWKQRRFLSDQPKASILENKPKRLLKSKFTERSSYNGGVTQFPIICNNEALFLQSKNEITSVGQGMKPAQLKNPTNTTSNHFIQDDINFFPGTSYFPQSKVDSATESVSGLYSSGVNNLKGFSNVGDESMLGPINNLYTNSISTVVDSPITHHNPVNIQNLPTVPTNSFCIMNPNDVQSKTLSNNLIKPNPIHCLDTENCLKGNYIKPGSYNPPQKPIKLQKVVDNSISIDNIPIAGISFLYLNPQDASQQTKPLANSKCPSSNKIHKTWDKVCVQESDDVSKTTQNVTETFRDTLIATKPKENFIMKDSESEILKSHFHLFDETSNHSSSTNINHNNETENFRYFENTTASKDNVEPQPNMNDWLTNILCKGDDKTEGETNLNKSCNSFENHEYLEECITFRDLYYEETDKMNKSIPAKTRKDIFDSCAFIHGMNQQSKNKTNLQRKETTNEIQKKLKKNKRYKDDFSAAKNQNHPVPLRKLKSTLKSSITKQVSEKLKTIVDCLWNIEISSLVEAELNSEKEAPSVELTVRNFLQAMKCKLTNHGYDTLEQVRTDFERYFEDVKRRNKENKRCTDVVETLEKVFSSQVEKHFGTSQQFKPECVGTVDLFHDLKTCKSKKTFQRC